MWCRKKYYYSNPVNWLQIYPKASHEIVSILTSKPYPPIPPNPSEPKSSKGCQTAPDTPVPTSTRQSTDIEEEKSPSVSFSNHAENNEHATKGGFYGYESTGTKKWHNSDRNEDNKREHRGEGRIGDRDEDCQVIGLRNSGNTCYANSVLQCLLASTELYSAYDDPSIGLDENSLPINTAFKTLMEFMRISDESIDPQILLDKVKQKEDSFDNKDQHDAHEFLLSLLNLLDSEFNPESQQGIIDKVFGGLFCNSMF